MKYGSYTHEFRHKRTIANPNIAISIWFLECVVLLDIMIMIYLIIKQLTNIFPSMAVTRSR